MVCADVVVGEGGDVGRAVEGDGAVLGKAAARKGAAGFEGLRGQTQKLKHHHLFAAIRHNKTEKNSSSHGFEQKNASTKRTIERKRESGLGYPQG